MRAFDGGLGIGPPGGLPVEFAGGWDGERSEAPARDGDQPLAGEVA